MPSFFVGDCIAVSSFPIHVIILGMDHHITIFYRKFCPTISFLTGNRQNVQICCFTDTCLVLECFEATKKPDSPVRFLLDCGYVEGMENSILLHASIEPVFSFLLTS